MDIKNEINNFEHKLNENIENETMDMVKMQGEFNKLVDSLYNAKPKKTRKPREPKAKK